MGTLHKDWRETGPPAARWAPLGYVGLAVFTLGLASGCGPGGPQGPAGMTPAAAWPAVTTSAAPGSGPGAGSPAVAGAAPPAGPVAVAVDPAGRPVGPPEADQAAFGAVEGIWRAEGERVALYGTREQPFAGKLAGTTTSLYLQVAGKVYAIHWDDAERLALLKVGDTVNLHVADTIACKEDPTHPAGSRCWRLYHVYPGTRRIWPLTAG